MSAKVVNLNQYKNSKHRSWLQKSEARISDVIRHYLFYNFALDMDQLVEMYHHQKRECFDESWDYLDLRELISDIFVETKLLDTIIQDLNSKHWYDETKVSRQKILEICLSIFVLETGMNAG